MDIHIHSSTGEPLTTFYALHSDRNYTKELRQAPVEWAMRGGFEVASSLPALPTCKAACEWEMNTTGHWAGKLVGSLVGHVSL